MLDVVVRILHLRLEGFASEIGVRVSPIWAGLVRCLMGPHVRRDSLRIDLWQIFGIPRMCRPVRRESRG